MSQKAYIKVSLASLLSGILLLVAIGTIHPSTSKYFAVLAAILSVTGLFIMLYWNTRSHKWMCSKCGSVFRISMRDNLFGISLGPNSKHLFCSNCGRKTTCVAIVQNKEYGHNGTGTN